MATFSGSFVSETDKKKAADIAEHGFGEMEGERLILAPVEALYLTEKRRIKVRAAGGKAASGFESLLGRFKKQDKDIDIKYAVFRDLRMKGYVARTGLKYGTYFRVYEKGIRVGEGHSAWLVQPVREGWKTDSYDFARAVRLAHSVRKKMIWAVVDTEGDVTYYKLERMVP
jgi:tRNA-intron endonuclease